MVLWLAIILYGMWQHQTNGYYTISVIPNRQLSYLRNNGKNERQSVRKRKLFSAIHFYRVSPQSRKTTKVGKKGKWIKYIHRFNAESWYRVTTIHFTVYSYTITSEKIVTVVIVEFHFTDSFYAGFVFSYFCDCRRKQNHNGMRTQRAFFY